MSNLLETKLLIFLYKNFNQKCNKIRILVAWPFLRLRMGKTAHWQWGWVPNLAFFNLAEFPLTDIGGFF